MNQQNSRNFEMILTNREKLVLSGVKNVEAFGEDYLTLCTELGELTIEGNSLKIESLTKEDGEILIIGNISGMFYKDPKSEKGFLRKLFK